MASEIDGALCSSRLLSLSMAFSTRNWLNFIVYDRGDVQRVLVVFPDVVCDVARSELAGLLSTELSGELFYDCCAGQGLGFERLASGGPLHISFSAVRRGLRTGYVLPQWRAALLYIDIVERFDLLSAGQLLVISGSTSLLATAAASAFRLRSEVVEGHVGRPVVRSSDTVLSLDSRGKMVIGHTGGVDVRIQAAHAKKLVAWCRTRVGVAF